MSQGDSPRKQDSPPSNKNNSEPGSNAPVWRMLIWYIPALIFLLWLWQDVLTRGAVETISYSQFKQYLARGEVASAEIHDTDIVGVIRPKPSTAKPEAKTEAKPEAKPPAERHGSQLPNAAPSTQPPPRRAADPSVSVPHGASRRSEPGERA